MTRVDFGAMTGGAKRDSIRMARALRRETNVRREARCEEVHRERCGESGVERSGQRSEGGEERGGMRGVKGGVNLGVEQRRQAPCE